MGLWGGRFAEPTDDDLRKLNDSIGFDSRLYEQDITGSIAYARAIADAEVISQSEADQIVGGLETIREEFNTDSFQFTDDDEDIHTAVERRLIELIGPVGGKLHTGRSRNDQVATDFRLWTMQAMHMLDEQLAQLQVAIIEKSEQHLSTLMPGYTHLQPAQPITVAHWLMSFFWMLARDRDRLADAQKRVSVLPLGSGALAGTPLKINRDRLAGELGFNSYSHNSLDAVSDRDFVAECMFVISLTGIHLSRLAEDIILYSNPAFGFVRLNDRYSTGSSLMPQKRNADPMELTRGKAGRLVGNLTGFLTTLKGLPSGYNKDLQEDKEPLFDSLDSLTDLLPVITAVIRTLEIDAVATQRALVEEMLATDMADYLVEKGMPFRQSHHVVGQAVQLAAKNGVKLSKIPLADLVELSDLFCEDVYAIFDFSESVSKRATPGGTAPAAIRAQILAAQQLLQR